MLTGLTVAALQQPAIGQPLPGSPDSVPRLSGPGGGIRISVFPTTPTSGDPWIPPDSVLLGGLAQQSGAQLLLRGMPYGYYDDGALVSLVATTLPLSSSRAGVNGGFEAGVPAMAAYGAFDMVNLYQGVGSTPPWLVLTGVSYDATHVYPPAGTAFTPAQLTQLRRAMWVTTNSVDPAMRHRPAAAGALPALDTYGSTVASWSPSAITVTGWTVPGGGNAAPGQVPVPASPQIAYFGTPTKQFARNVVMQNNPQAFPDSQTHAFEAEELDMMDFGTVDYQTSWHGYTCQYVPLGLTPAADGVPAHGVLPTSDSYCVHLGGPLPDQLLIDELGLGNAIRTNATVMKGNGGVATVPGATAVMVEHDKYMDGDVGRFVTWLQRDTVPGLGSATHSIRQGVFINGRQGSADTGTLAEGIIYGGTANPSGIRICGYDQACVSVDSNGRLHAPYGFDGTGPVSTTGPASAASVKTGVTTVAGLPKCDGAAEGMRAAVSDARRDAYHVVLTGGGRLHLPALCNGTSWIDD